jgi:hypothetical protein
MVSAIKKGFLSFIEVNLCMVRKKKYFISSFANVIARELFVSFNPYIVCMNVQLFQHLLDEELSA